MDYRNYMTCTRYSRGLYFEQDELNRRWEAVRGMMRANKANLLLVLDGRMEGEGEWLTGMFSPSPEWPSGGIIVPMGGPIIVSMSVRPAVETHGEGFGGIDPTPNPLVKTTQGFDIMDIKDYLLRHNKIGLVHPEMMSAELADCIKTHIPDVVFVDLTDEFRKLLAVRSDAELPVIRDAAAMHDKIFAGLRQMIRAERLESEIVKNMRFRAMTLGSNGEHPGEVIRIHLTSAPDGGESVKDDMLYPGRRLLSGDRVNVRMQAATTFGIYGNIARSFVLGRPAEQTAADWQAAVDITDYAASMLKPGTTLAAVREAVNQRLAAAGYEPDESMFIHGMGYAYAAYPCCLDETANAPLKAGMYLALQPHVRRKGQDAYCCGDAYLVTENGAERLTNCSRELVVL